MRTWKISLIVVAFGAIVTFADPAIADYPDLVNSFNPIAYWRFNDASSAEGDPAADSSAGGTHDGLYHNGVTLITSGLPGPGSGGKAASFDGDDDYVGNIATAGFPVGAGDRTFIAWGKYDPNALTYGYNTWFEYGERTGTNVFGLGAYNANDSLVPNKAIGVSQWGNSVGTDPILDGDWHCFAVTVSSSNYRVYLDGQYLRQKVMTTDTILTAEAMINTVPLSGPSGGSVPFPGLLDEMALFGTALTDQNIEDLYQEMFIPEPATLGLLLLGGLALLRKRKTK